MSACSGQHVLEERPDSRPEISLGGALAGGDISIESWDDMVAAASSSAVKVIVKDCRGRVMGTGSGFNVGQFVVTNRHVVEGAGRIDLMSVKQENVPVARWAIAPDDDLALLEPGVPLTSESVALASADPISGDLVASVGFPLGGEMITRQARVLKRLYEQDYSQSYAITTNASVQPGDSGGVLVNSKGEVVAVTTAIALKDNVTVAVPVSRLHAMMSGADFRFPSDGCE